MMSASKSSLLMVAAATLLPAFAFAAGDLSVSVWSDKGADAVYEPGDRVQIRARSSDDANLLVYDIDAEGYVHVLFPYRGHNGYVDGRQTFMIPAADAQDELVVRGPVGQGYVVAIASRAPFRAMPWYLRPYDPQAEGVGYVGGPDHGDNDDEGITPEGRIVGDPFVAIERIRREVVGDPEDQESVATDYFSYYVHERVRYPRYVCNDCHRPGHYAWWDGFDPYYASCSVVDFRVNFGWFWGSPYWSGYVPYYVYVVRPSCPPFYRPWSGTCYSSWDGWRRWNTLWGSHLTRYKAPPPPADYVPPSRYKWDRRWQGERPAPPGFLAGASVRGRIPVQRMPQSGNPEAGVIQRTDWRPGGERRPVMRTPMGEAPRDNGEGRSVERPRWGADRAPAGGANDDPRGTPGSRREGRPSLDTPRGQPGGEVRRDNRPRDFDNPPRRFDNPPRGEAPRVERPAPPRGEPRFERPAPPRGESPRYDRPAPPRGESPRYDRPAQRREPPRVERPSAPRGERSNPPPREKNNRGNDKGRGDRPDPDKRGGGGGGGR